MDPFVIAVVPMLRKRTLTPAEGGPVAYQVPGIRFVHGVSMARHAINSIADQTVPVRGVASAIDQPAEDGQAHGAGVTRGLALAEALKLIEWHGVSRNEAFVAFLDDDDLWYPHHLETHLRLLAEGGDVAYSYFDGNQMQGWEVTHKGRVWDPAEPHHITTTTTVRASFAAEAADAFGIDAMHTEWSGEDWQFILNLNAMGARFVGTGDVTWHYRVHYGNTSGLPSKGDALA